MIPRHQAKAAILRYIAARSQMEGKYGKPIPPQVLRDYLDALWWETYQARNMRT